MNRGREVERNCPTTCWTENTTQEGVPLLDLLRLAVGQGIRLLCPYGDAPDGRSKRLIPRPQSGKRWPSRPGAADAVRFAQP